MSPDFNHTQTQQSPMPHPKTGKAFMPLNVEHQISLLANLFSLNSCHEHHLLVPSAIQMGLLYFLLFCFNKNLIWWIHMMCSNSHKISTYVCYALFCFAYIIQFECIHMRHLSVLFGMPSLKHCPNSSEVTRKDKCKLVLMTSKHHKM